MPLKTESNESPCPYEAWLAKKLAGMPREQLEQDLGYVLLRMYCTPWSVEAGEPLRLRRADEPLDAEDLAVDLGGYFDETFHPDNLKPPGPAAAPPVNDLERRECPFCGGAYQLDGETQPGLWHSDPACAVFERLDARAFCAAARAIRRRT